MILCGSKLEFRLLVSSKSLIRHRVFYGVEWSLGAELWSGLSEWSGVESNFGVAKILITPADSVYLTFSNMDWSFLN